MKLAQSGHAHPLLRPAILPGFRPRVEGCVRRRDFIKAIAGSAVAFPIATRAQQPGRLHHVVVFLQGAEQMMGVAWRRCAHASGISVISKARISL